MTDDLQTLAAEALLRAGFMHYDEHEVADAVLAAVLPAHRRQVLAEAGLSTTPRPLWKDADLAALRDEDALRAWYAARHPYACIDIGAGRFFAEYLADRFDAKEDTDG